MSENSPDIQEETPQAPASSNKFGHYRKLIKEQMVVAQERFKIDTKKNEPASSFLGIAADKVRADLAAQYDKKTGLRNADTFVLETQREMARVNRDPEHHKLIIGISDLDYFGDFNKKYGELPTDKILQTVAKTFKDTTRTVDLTGRVGGEEFAFTLPYDKLSEDPALHQPEIDSPNYPSTRIRKAIEDIPVSDTLPEKVTASIGSSEYVHGETYEECMGRASIATRIAKLTGKNRTVVTEQIAPHKWQYKDITNNLTYIPTLLLDSPDQRGLASLHEITEDKTYMVVYSQVKGVKPTLKLIEPAAK